MAKACSRILVTVATLDKRAYKYIPEKHSGLHSALNKLLSKSQPIPAHRGQIYMNRGDFAGVADPNDRNNVLPSPVDLWMYVSMRRMWKFVVVAKNTPDFDGL